MTARRASSMLLASCSLTCKSRLGNHLPAWLQRCASRMQSGLAAKDIPGRRADREKMEYDVLIVGAGPAGLSAAIKIKQLCKDKGKELSVCVIEKGSDVGSHILSGNVFEPRGLTELLPDWKTRPDAPIQVPVVSDRFYVLPTEQYSLRLPTPRPLRNKGNYVVSLSEVCRWLGKQAEELGVDILPGYGGKELLYDWDNRVVGVATGDCGIGKDGRKKEGYAPGVELMAKLTLLAEGCRGSLAESVMRRFNLRANSSHQTYALGMKEVWEVPASQHKPGTVLHTLGFPLDHSTYGGGFLYHMADNKVALGLVVSLDYSNPHLNMFQEFQRWKTHPIIRQHIEGGTCLQYGARALNEGGFQSIPQLSFPGGALLGCSAGFVNVPKIKGTHTAMKSGMLGAEAAFRALTLDGSTEKYPVKYGDMSIYDEAFKRSWVHDELQAVRNIRPAFHLGLVPGILHAAVDTFLLRGRAPWTLRHGLPDHERLKPAAESPPIVYPKPDGKITFDLPKALYLSGTNHNHDQPSHLQVLDAGLPERVNAPHYAGPETKYCPAGVYEYTTDEHSRKRLVINAQNCLHCKTCDIKDPNQNIKWTVPEGGGGPGYTCM